MPKRVNVTSENKSGRNEKFHDNFTGKNMNRSQFVQAIQNGEYKNYTVRNLHGLKTPASKPDSTTNNNLD
ncbi:hypothetical protein HLG73_05990 [Lacticaseibacillus paracasei]|uniref:hypothetical protein n=1 Tax=Lacticaseibacillus paracasei TaxID=1597 RepID=UPI0023584189|nr:hypothetical protein [Lacticaseibacillus paracasei]WCZ18911.1 hypothetical protein HLG73_05990 [Lacticaseibacillus paracasei]